MDYAIVEPAIIGQDALALEWFTAVILLGRFGCPFGSFEPPQGGVLRWATPAPTLQKPNCYPYLLEPEQNGLN